MIFGFFLKVMGNLNPVEEEGLEGLVV